MIGNPITSCRCKRDSLSGFCTLSVTLANRLELKDRLPVEFGKTGRQRNQFVAEVKRAVALCPLLIIIVKL